MFKLFEIGNAGRPVFLYEIAWGGTVWRYTSADRDITFEAQTFKAVAISDEGVTQGANAQPFTVNVPVNLPIVALFRGTPPAIPVTLRVRRFHKDDPDQEALIYWLGTIGNVKRKGIAKAQIMGLPVGGGTRRTGLRLCFERNCPHALYDTQCKVDKATKRTITTITALTGNTITVAGLGAYTGAQYQGGFLEFIATTEGTIDRRSIEQFNGGTNFTLMGRTDRLTVGMAVTIYLGCDLTPETCNGTFNNLPNHGGFKFMPGKSPFDGNPVF